MWVLGLGLGGVCARGVVVGSCLGSQWYVCGVVVDSKIQPLRVCRAARSASQIRFPRYHGTLYQKNSGTTIWKKNLEKRI